MSANREEHERRIQRFAPPPCPECKGRGVRVMSRTPYVLYVRCEQCLHLWSVPKPGIAPLGVP